MAELTQAQAAAIAASGGTTAQLTSPVLTSSAGGIGGAEVLLWEAVIDCDTIGGGVGNLQVSIDADAQQTTNAVGTDAATYHVKTGGTPGTAGGTDRANFSLTGTAARAAQHNVGSSFANPTGRLVVQITATVAGGGGSTYTLNYLVAHIKVASA